MCGDNREYFVVFRTLTTYNTIFFSTQRRPPGHLPFSSSSPLGYESTQARMGGTQPSARPLHRRRCLVHPGIFLPPSSSLRSPSTTLREMGDRIICLAGDQVPWSCRAGRDRDKSSPFFPAVVPNFLLSPASSFFCCILSNATRATPATHLPA